MVSSSLRLAVFGGLVVVSAATVPGALAVAASGPSHSQTISPHQGVAFNEQMSRAQVLTAVENELLNTLMDDPSILEMVKGLMKDALSGVVQSLSSVAKESCDKLAKSAADKIEEAAGSAETTVDDALDNIDGDASSSLVEQKVKALVLSKLEEEGFFDSVKEKAKHAWGEVKGAAKVLLMKVSDKLKPIVERALASIIPRLEGEANKLLVKACDVADKKLEAVQEKLQN